MGLAPNGGIVRGTVLTIRDGLGGPGLVDDGDIKTPLETFGADLAVWHKSYEDDSLTLNGSNVSAIKDYSGNGIDFTQSNAPNQPALGSTNGYNALHFSDPTAVLHIGVGPFTGYPQPYYLAAVVAPDTYDAALNENRYIAWMHNSPGVLFAVRDEGLGNVQYFTHYANGAQGSAPGDNTPLDGTAYYVICYYAGADSWIEINGTRYDAVGVGTQGLEAPGNNFVCYGTGGGFGAATSFYGKLFEGVWVQGAQAESKLSKLRDYIAQVAGNING